MLSQGQLTVLASLLWNAQMLIGKLGCASAPGRPGQKAPASLPGVYPDHRRRGLDHLPVRQPAPGAEIHRQHVRCVGFADASCALYLKEYGVYLAAAILACIPWGQVLAKKVDRSKPWVQTGIHLAAFVVFALAVTYMVKGTYNPFIYFTF